MWRICFAAVATKDKFLSKSCRKSTGFREIFPFFEKSDSAAMQTARGEMRPLSAVQIDRRGDEGQSSVGTRMKVSRWHTIHEDA
jgi:hypothetical protein